MSDAAYRRPDGSLASVFEMSTRRADAAAEESAAAAAREQADAEALARQQAAARAARVDAAAEPYASLQPPEAADLGIDVADLPPARARLARLLAWIASLQRQADDLTAGRETYLAAIGAPAVTQAALADLEKQDESGFFTWLKGGAKKIDKPTIRTFEHEQLATKLTTDTYEGRVAATALREAELQIDILARQIPILQGRVEGFVLAALVEHAELVGAEYIAAIRETEGILAALLGLASIARRVGEQWDGTSSVGAFYSSYSNDMAVDTALPRFGLKATSGAGPHWADAKAVQSIKVDKTRISQAAQPWRDLMRTWSADPRADPASVAAIPDAGRYGSPAAPAEQGDVSC